MQKRSLRSIAAKIVYADESTESSVVLDGHRARTQTSGESHGGTQVEQDNVWPALHLSFSDGQHVRRSPLPSSSATTRDIRTTLDTLSIAP